MKSTRRWPLFRVVMIAAGLVLLQPHSWAQPREVSPKKTVRYVALLKSTTYEFFRTMVQGYEEAKQKYGVELTIATPASTDPQEQLALCESLELSQPDVYLVAAVTEQNLVPCLAQASARGALIVDVDGNLNFESIKKLKVEVPFGVASSNYEIGVTAGTYARKFSGKALILEGAAGSLPSENRVRGFREAAGHLRFVASLPTDWDSQRAFTITADVLTAHPDLSVIYAAADIMAIGALEAIKAAGRTNITIVGTDGLENVRTAIKGGAITATVAQLPYLMALQSVELAQRWVQKGERFSGNQKVPSIMLDRDVLASGSDPLLQYIK